ncbi:MAG: chorismate mutase [Acidimicrobiia bacterium]|nr:chorismate mutase [Acidimicrobiia bacterium]
MTFLAIRGATTCAHDTKEEVSRVTQELLTEMIKRNSLMMENIVSVIFTATNDIHSEFPATASRKLEGFSEIPVMCAQELDISGAMPNCIRVMMHVDIDMSRKDIKHVFMGNAQKLRKDLNQDSK